MTDQVALLEAIRAHPRENTPRLMYADWLDDHGTCDRDAATAEFIRLALGPTKHTRQWPHAAYKWLLNCKTGTAMRPGSWYRLVPALCALDATEALRADIVNGYPDPVIGTTVARYRVPAPPLPWRTGRLVEAYFNFRAPGPNPARTLIRMHLTFDAGFLRKCDVAAGDIMAPHQLAALSAALAADQPLCRSVGVFR